MATYTCAYDIGKKPTSVDELALYLQSKLTIVQGVRFDDAANMIKVDFDSMITGTNRTFLDDLIQAYDGYEPIENVVQVRFKEEYIKTQGNFCIKGLTISSAPANSTTSHTFSWPYAISLLATKIVSVPESNHGDVLHGMTAPSIPIGLTTSSHMEGDTTVNVSPTTVAFMNVGYMAKFSSIDTIEVISVNKEANTITLVRPLAEPHPEGTPVLFERHLAKDIVLMSGMQLTIGDSTVGGIPLPANTPVTIVYENKHNNQVDFTVFVEYFY